MTGRRTSVFFYGLFMDVEALRTTGIQPVNPRRCRVSGYSLRIGQRATLTPEPGAHVHGVLMELSHEEIGRLYAEPSVSQYRPEAVNAELEDGTRMAALCFNLPVPDRPGEVNEEYARQLRDVARRAGLPVEYIKTIG